MIFEDEDRLYIIFFRRFSKMNIDLDTNLNKSGLHDFRG